MAGRDRAAAPRGLALTLGRVVVVVALALGAAGLWASMRTGPATDEERVEELTATLRCPTCTAESIDESQAPLAAAMREEVRAQVEAGRTDAEILAWFRERYGSTVLLAPPARGFSVLLWALPVTAAVAALAVWAVRRRGPRAGDGRSAAGAADQVAPVRRRGAVAVAAAASVAVVAGLVALADPAAHEGAERAGGTVPSGTAGNTGDDPDRAIRALRSAVGQAPRDAGLWLALGRALDQRGRLAAAEHAYREAVAVEPALVPARLRLAFVLVRTDRAAPAAVVLRSLLADHPRHVEALLLLGVVQHRSGDDAARRTLRRFLALAPRAHPAIPRVRQMLGSDGR